MSQNVLSRFAVPVRLPPRFVLEGDPKIGKTTLASQAPDVAMVMAEDGALGLEVPQIRVTSWEDVISVLKALLEEKHSYKWVALDTANAIEAMCADYVCKRDFDGVWQPTKGKDAFHSYGKGDKAVAYEFKRLLVLLDSLQKKGLGVILICHVGLHKSGNALGADFMKFGGDLNKHTWALIAAWADQIGYATRDVRVSFRDGEAKAKANAIGSERWIQFEGSPGLDAGCRAGYEMPERILLDWQEYEKALSSDPIKGLVTQAMELLDSAAAETKATVAERLGGKITQKALREIGKQKLNALIGWLLSQKKESN